MTDSLALRVWGDFACFTREMKVERVSYPLMTPTAAAIDVTRRVRRSVL